MVTFLDVLRMVYTFRNLLGLLESVYNHVADNHVADFNARNKCITAKLLQHKMLGEAVM